MPDVAALVGRAREPIVVADDGGIRYLILNRPEARNALTRAMRADFAGLLAAADADDRIEAVVLTGAGGCFSAGVDTKDGMGSEPPVEPNPGAALRRMAKPVIAAIDGPCVTGALEMALSCSLAVATPAARFADTHVRVGLFPRWGGGTLLSNAIGAARARYMMLTGAFVDAQTALAWGIAGEIVPAAALLDRAAELAGAMAANARANPLAYALVARMLDSIDASTPAERIERDLLARFDESRATNRSRSIA